MIDKFKFWGSATVGTKGQIVIPADARDAFDICEGDKILVLSMPSKSGIVLVKPEILAQYMQQVQLDVQEILNSNNKSKEN